MPEALQIANCQLPIAKWRTRRPQRERRSCISRLLPRFNLQLAICNLQFAIVFFFFGPSASAAADSFPRGPGLYFSPIKLVVLLLIYLAWVRTCWWVDADARDLKLPTATWNPLLFLCGVGGLLVVAVLPIFLISLFVLLALYLVPTFAYVN